jgi:hypothetical protein
MNVLRWMGGGSQTSTGDGAVSDGPSSSGALSVSKDWWDDGERYFGMENVRLFLCCRLLLHLLKLSRWCFLPVWKYLVRNLFRSADPPRKESEDDADFLAVSSYANSVLQALYYCRPFRDSLLEGLPPPLPLLRRAPPKRPSTARPGTSSSRSAGIATTASGPSLHKRSPSIGGSLASDQHPTVSASPAASTGTPASTANEPTTIFSTLRDLFHQIASQSKPTGTVAPRAFVNQLRRDNELFRSTMHQDAHEFFNYLVNAIAEQAELEANEKGKGKANSSTDEWNTAKTWVHKLFEGVLTNETKCLTCETVCLMPSFIFSWTILNFVYIQSTSREESFLDLSIDIEANSSVSACLRQFSASEMLRSRNKFWCDSCCGLQEAEKRFVGCFLLPVFTLV